MSNTDNLSPMTPEEFQAWAHRHDLVSKRAIAAALGGIGVHNIRRYQSGESEIPLWLKRLSQFIDRHGVDGWIPDDDQNQPTGPIYGLGKKITMDGYRLTSRQVSAAWERMQNGEPFTVSEIRAVLITNGVPRQDENGRKLAANLSNAVVRNAKRHGEIERYGESEWIAINRRGGNDDER